MRNQIGEVSREQSRLSFKIRPEQYGTYNALPARKYVAKIQLHMQGLQFRIIEGSRLLHSARICAKLRLSQMMA